MSWIKIITINLLVICSSLFLLMILPPLANSSYKLIQQIGLDPTSDSRAYLELYKDFGWAEQHWKEFHNLSTTYYDYITWRKDDFSGETINIIEGIRHSSIPNEIVNSKETWFFGGSTAWGSGVNDKNTLPSLVAIKNQILTKNYAEPGYISRQSLSYLQNLYLMGKGGGNTVIFYDGVNDVAMRCRSESKGIGSDREIQIRNNLIALGGDSRGGFSFNRTFSQLKDFMVLVSNRLFTNNSAEFYYSCANSSQRANFVAETLVNTWIQAQLLAEANGDQFIAILQPVAFYKSPNISYLNLNDSNSIQLKKQFEALYPLIIEYASSSDLNFFDLTDIFNGCNDCYVDFCHVGIQGHKTLAKHVSGLVP